MAAACAPAPPAPRASSEAVASIAPAASRPRVEVAVTVDDLPIHGPLPPGVTRQAVFDGLLGAFEKHHLKEVYGFVNGKRVEEHPESEALLRRWIAAGHPLGNHTFSHPSLVDSKIESYLADLEKGEEILARLEPDAQTRRVFRYPFLFEGETLEKRDGVRAYLKEHQYAIAEVTIDADDWAFNPPFARCAARGDAGALAELRARFVKEHVDELARMRRVTLALTGREVPHVLMLHVGAADADAIDALLTAFEREGARWVRLREALADPFYANDPHLPVRSGAAFPYVLAKSRGLLTEPPIFARSLEGELERVCR